MSSYCTRGDMELIYGVTNLEKWADADNDADANKITARILWAIRNASNQLDDLLRNSPYTIPFVTAPQSVVDIVALMAGVVLYESPRAIVDGDDANEQLFASKEMFLQFCDEVKSKRKVLDAPRNTPSQPGVYNVAYNPYPSGY